MDAGDGLIRVPPNCGQQLYDVIGLTEPNAGLDGERRRVVGITLRYGILRREYEMQLGLGAV
jgi:hypothetical protein